MQVAVDADINHRWIYETIFAPIYIYFTITNSSLISSFLASKLYESNVCFVCLSLDAGNTVV